MNASLRRVYPAVILFFLIIAIPCAAYAEDTGRVAVPANATPLSVPLFEDEKPVVHFFYNTNCGECQKTLPYIQEMMFAHPEVIFRVHDIRESDTDRALFQEFKKHYGREFLPVPSLFIGELVLSGYEEITDNLDAAIQLTLKETGTAATIPGTAAGDGKHEELTLPLVISAALVDGINPCAFAVLIFLLISILALDTRRRVLIVGATFISAVFFFYFLSGMGLFMVIQSSGMARLISLAAAAVAIAAGAISIGEALWRTRSQYLSIPDSTRGIIEKWVKKGSIPSAFVLGIMVGMFELPCTGGIYLAILSLISNRMTVMEGIPYLLLYNIFFILPLVVILGVVAIGIAPERLERIREKKRPYIRLAMGAVMILLGVLLILEIF